jgi:deazaflavin-dependent oxidoreductase (nitroreductase family)
MSGQGPDIGALKAFDADVVEEFRVNGGNVAGQFTGTDLLSLTTTGARSGQFRVSPLQYSRVDGSMIVVGAYAGADVDPAWVYNIRANPCAHIEVGSRPSTS